MREIKFRGKRTDNGEWVVGDYSRYSKEKSIIMVDLLEQEDYWVWSATVGQCTGLKDKNGKEIYEGDVVTSNEYPFQDDGEYNYHGIIEWSEELTSYYLVLKIANPSKRGISDGIGEALQNYNAWDLEIIGNIHDNPELLEVQP